MSVKKDIVSRVSKFGHDVKNTLTVTKIQTEVLGKNCAKTPESVEILQKLNRSVDLVVSQVEKLVDDVRKSDSRE